MNYLYIKYFKVEVYFRHLIIKIVTLNWISDDALSEHVKWNSLSTVYTEIWLCDRK